MTLMNPQFTSNKIGRQMRIVVGIATSSRPTVMPETVRKLGDQTRKPDTVYVSYCNSDHLGDAEKLEVPFDLHFVKSAQGACRQRNAILRDLSATDIILFIDDDFILAPDYLERMERIFLENPDVVQVTGNVVADGVLGPGLDHDAAQKILDEAVTKPIQTEIAPIINAYGCNMAMRIGPLLDMDYFFDERLPHYGWLEDVDYSMRIKDIGRVVRAQELLGVHLGTKRGRSPGKRLGYSQVANPLYLSRKGTLPLKRALRIMGRNVCANVVRTFRPQPWVDHRGRLFGNFRALFDLALGRLDPARSV